jgi:hypothetical protein
MEQFLPLIVIAGLSLLTNYLNKKAEQDQQEKSRKLQENSGPGKRRQPEGRPSMSEAQSTPSVSSERESEPTLTDWSTWHRSSEDRSRDMGQTPDRRNIAPSSNPGTTQTESREGHSPVRRFWDELNDAAKEWSESMASPPAPSPKPVQSSMGSSPKAAAKSAEVQKANELASASLRTAQKKKKQLDDRLGKNKSKVKNPWDLASSKEKRPRSLAKSMLKKPSTARQAIALSMILAPPKSLTPDEDHWFSR